ncbi:MAG: MFS transporter [Deltaproteobacteria bacterium]|nr:MFS transporter [Deltaproteobacteria bacterium]
MLDRPNHSRAFRLRRFANWFTLGLTYATFYMGRYNLNVVKDKVEHDFFHGSQTEFGLIGLCGFWTYAISELVNGPLIAERIGGRKSILLGAAGGALFNFSIGMLFLGAWTTKLLVGMSLLYSCNMFFQSFGAMSMVKVNAPWFHVNERGVFGGVFGIMISLGYLLAFGVSGFILKHDAIPWYFVFLAPSIAMGIMFVISFFVVRDHPEDTGHSSFATGDASDGDHSPVTFSYIVENVFKHPVLLTLVGAEFCTGFVRQGLLFFFAKWLGQVHHIAPGTTWFNVASVGITVGGIVGGLIAGFLSDHVFQARRPPVALIYYGLQVVSVLVMTELAGPHLAAIMVGVNCAWIFGVHGMLTGTASMDFGGRKGAATAAGMLDGIQYVASGITSVVIGYAVDHYGWGAWPWAIAPFSLVGGALMLRVWNVKPQPKTVVPAAAAAPQLEPGATA